MQMHNPPHPGTFIEGVYLEPRALSIHRAATGGWQKPRVA
jgi:plasmid maintenance system antidote protein VapI